MCETATLTRLTVGRSYVFMGQPGLVYVGKGRLHGLHTFRGDAGTQAVGDGRLAELMGTGKVKPEGPRPAGRRPELVR